MPVFDKDVFISYSSKDRDWAEKLYISLSNSGIPKNRIYLDTKRLTAGDQWETSLLQDLLKSKHLIVLWSKNSIKSHWVIEEKSRFTSTVDPLATGQFADGRRLIMISLDEQNEALKSIQSVEDLRITGAFENAVKEAEAERAAGNKGVKAADKVDPQVWMDVVSKVWEAVTSDIQYLDLNLAILATTADRVDKINFDYVMEKQQVEDKDETLGEVLKRIGIHKKEDLKPFYGARPGNWCPFQRPVKRPDYEIETIMRRAINQVNATLALKKLKQAWRTNPVGDFWLSTPEAEAARYRLTHEESVIVIDPLYFYDDALYSRYEKIRNILQNEKALVMVFAPFMLPTPTSVMRKLISYRAQDIYQNFYEPLISASSYARIGPDVGDETDIKRWLGMTLRLQEDTEQQQGGRAWPVRQHG